MTIGERMLVLRAKKRWTQAQLAKELDEHSSTIFRFENNKTKPHKAAAIRVDMKLRKLEETEQ